VPKWAQRRHDLWNSELLLLNESPIRYRQLTVPCCRACNGDRLKPLEDALSVAVYQGRDAVLKLGYQPLFLWLGKLIYGLLYKEATLMANRADPSSDRIVPQRVLAAYHMHELLLRQAGGGAHLVNGIPGSIYVFNVQQLPDPRMEWDYQDFSDQLVVGCRVGRVALVADLADCGLLHQYEMFEECESLELHPLQFRELLAAAAYISTLRPSSGAYLYAETAPVRILQLASLSPTCYAEWDHAKYAKVLAWYLECDWEKLFTSPDLVWSCLHRPDGTLRELPFDELPFSSLRDVTLR
jgi:hypothetical protein